MPGIGIGISPLLNRGGGTDWSSYWATQFTGIPIAYSGNALYSHLSRTILKEGDTFYHYGEASSVNPTRWWIELAKSPDGLRFSKPGSALLAFGGEGELDEWGQADPSVMKDGDEDWKMWYDAMDGTEHWYSLGYATSVDGLTWSKYGTVLNKGTAGSWDDNFMHHPCVVKHDGIYYMFYAGASSTDMRYKIGLATSPDGINFTREATNPVITVGEAGQWDSAYIRPSNPIKIYDTWYMWYWAYDNSNFAIGLATSPDLVTWTKRGRVLQTGASANWVRLVEGTNPMDKIAQIYYVGKEAPFGVGLAKATINNDKTVIDAFDIDGLKYGDTVEGTTFATYAANYLYGGRVTVVTGGISSKVRLFITSYMKPTSGKLKCALYTNVSDKPSALIAVTEEKNWADVLVDAWNDFEFTSPQEISSGDYWIATNSNIAYKREKIAGGTLNWFNKASTYGDFPNPIVTPSVSGYSGNDVYIIIDGISNVWSVSLASEPTNVYFNSIKGNKQTLKSAVNSEFDWYWADGMLYIYSGVEHPDIRYVITYE